MGGEVADIEFNTLGRRTNTNEGPADCNSLTMASYPFLGGPRQRRLTEAVLRVDVDLTHVEQQLDHSFLFGRPYPALDIFGECEQTFPGGTWKDGLVLGIFK